VGDRSVLDDAEWPPGAGRSGKIVLMFLKRLIPSHFRKLYEMMNREQRRRGAFLIALMFVGMLFEALGIGAIVPALGLMMSSNIAAQYPILKPVIAWLGYPSQAELVVMGMLTLVAIYIVKSGVLLFLAWRQGQFLVDLYSSFSLRLYANYLRQSYAFHLRRNSAQLLRNVSSEVIAFSSGASATLTLLTESSMLAGVTLLLFAVEPLGTLVVCVLLGGAGYIFQRLMRERVMRWGRDRQRHEGFRLQQAQQGLGGVKDIKLLGREDDFLKRYATHNMGTAHALQRQYFAQQTPRLWLESLSVFAVALIVCMAVGTGRPASQLLPVIGLFGAAALRLVPSLNRVMVAMQGSRFAVPVIELLHNELIADKAPPAQTGRGDFAFNREIVLDHISLRYSEGGPLAVNDVSVSIPAGTSVGFVGGSGAGKSTLIDIVLGLLTPTQGRVMADGVDIQSNLRGWQNLIGYVPQSIFLTDDTIRRNVAFGLADTDIDEAAVKLALRHAQMETFVDELPLGMDTVVGERGVRLSGGQRQRIGIARAVYHDPKVLVLDEATSALDTGTETGVMNAVKAMRGEKTILIIAHRLSTIEHCDMVLRLDHGRVVATGQAALTNVPDAHRDEIAQAKAIE
jgi:ABC-type multidrug transport system fused ATPase/permease subunit